MKLSLKNKNPWFITFIVVAIICLFATLILSLDAGNSGDEDGFQYPYAEEVVNFYATFGKDTTCLQNEDMGMHGGWFDPMTVAFIKIFDIDNPNIFRHLLNALIGFIAMLFAALLAKRFSNWRAAVITLILIFLSPRFLGHSFNNPKDIPFAAFFMVSLYYIILFIQEYPKPKISTCIKLAIAMALAIVSRIGGYLLFAYFGLFVVLYYLFTINRKDYFKSKNLKIVYHLFFKYICIIIGAFLLTIPLWPYIMDAPLDNTIKSFTGLSHFFVSLRQLFEGTLQWSDTLPWYYTPKYIFMTIPVAVIVGFLLYPFIGGWRKQNRFNTLVIYFACIFPIFWIIYSNANVYGGWRHAIFAYPPMVVCAGLGFNAIIDLCKNKYLKIAATALPFLLLIMPFIHIVKNHPYEYVYFNKLAGGIDNAYGNYEMDYYYHSTREATEWIIANAEKNGLETTDKIKVASWHTASVGYFLRNDTANFQNRFTRWHERGNNDWDYAIFVITGMMPEQIKGEYFPPKNSVHEILVDDKPICFILKREDKSDFIGNNFKKENQIDSAIFYLEKALEYDPYNESAITNLIELYFNTGRIEDGKRLLDLGLTYLPKSETFKYFLAHYYMSTNNIDQVIYTANEMIEYNYKFSSAYHLLFNSYIQKGDYISAEKSFLRMMDVDAFDNQAFKQLVELYKFQGMTEAIAHRRVYLNIAKSLEKRGKKEEAETYKQYAKQL